VRVAALQDKVLASLRMRFLLRPILLRRPEVISLLCFSLLIITPWSQLHLLPTLLQTLLPIMLIFTAAT